jgi:hypothetical protein
MAKMAVVTKRKKKAIAVLAIHFLLKACRKRRIRCWRQPWIAKHDELGAYSNLVRELEVDGSLRNYLRMTKAQFDNIVTRVTPVLQRSNTTFRASITPGERVAVTLRFLATGELKAFF